MKLALLLCGHAQEKFHPITGGDYDVYFQSYFSEYSDDDVTLECFDVTAGHYPQNRDDFDGFITTGSKYSVYDDLDWIKTLTVFFQTIHEEGRKLVGVCFGHQMMAHALGGRVEKSANGWGIGVKTFQVYDTAEDEAWLKPKLDKFNIFLSCQDQVQELPSDSVVLAGSDFCPVGMYRVGETMLGVQGHPEFTADYAEALMADRVDRIPADVIAAARKTMLIVQPSKHELASWIINFIQY
ncbi:MAG: GMP synthase-like glutamine amidotransferase [Candidatus Promineifilaceae bacterium]|jgi:GMP synthase-like glutamine amidotransferase